MLRLNTSNFRFGLLEMNCFKPFPWIKFYEAFVFHDGR